MINKWLASGLSILVLFFLGSSCGFDLASLLPEQTMDPLPTAIASRTIPQNSRQKLVWRRGLQSFDRFNEPTKFYLFPPVVEKAIYIYYVKGNEFSLHRLDLTGNEIA